MVRNHSTAHDEGEVSPVVNSRRGWWMPVLAVAAGGSLFWFVVELAGGFARGDSEASMFSAVMMAHGDWSCAYPSSLSHASQSGPIFPILSAVAQWISRAGFSSTFPSRSHFGVNCQHAFASYVSWEKSVPAFSAVLGTAIVAWLFLCAACVVVIRSSTRGGVRSVGLMSISLAITPPVVFALQENFHPQDLLALALTLLAVALLLRRRPFAAGLFLALGVMSQPYALLGGVALLVVSPWRDRRGIAIGGSLAIAVVALFMSIVSGRQALWAIFLGTGDTSIHSNTWMAELHFSSELGIVVSRFLPLVAAAVISFWSYRRRPDISRDPVSLLALLAVCWSIRLIFEENLFGYYCAATGVTLLLCDIVARRSPRGVVVWLALVLFAFDDFGHQLAPWGNWPVWVWQVLIAPSAFLIALHSLRQSLTTPPVTREPASEAKSA